MGAVARLAQQEFRAAADDFLAEGDEGRSMSSSVISSGLPPFSATMLQPKEVCSGVKR
jgi:hypothetical protein